MWHVMVIMDSSTDSHTQEPKVISRTTSIRRMWITSGVGLRLRPTSNFPFGSRTKRWEEIRSHKMALTPSCCLPISYHRPRKFGDVSHISPCFTIVFSLSLYIFHVYYTYICTLLVTSSLTCLSCITLHSRVSLSLPFLSVHILDISPPPCVVIVVLLCCLWDFTTRIVLFEASHVGVAGCLFF